MSTIQSRGTRAKSKKLFNIDLKISMKILFHYPHNSSNPKILKVFLKSFLTEMKPTKYLVKEKKKEAINEKKKRGGEILLCACPNFPH